MDPPIDRGRCFLSGYFLLLKWHGLGLEGEEVWTGGIDGRTMSDSSDPMRSCSFLSNVISHLIINTISSLTERKRRAISTDLNIDSANLPPICSASVQCLSGWLTQKKYHISAKDEKSIHLHKAPPILLYLHSPISCFPCNTNPGYSVL